MNTLTKAEEQIMQVLWQIKRGFLKDVLEGMPEPKPHSNTVATVLKVLIDKGFAKAKPIGRFHLYSPAVSKEAYSKKSISGLVQNYFSGSYTDAVSFLVESDKLSVDDLELLLQTLKKK